MTRPTRDCDAVAQRRQVGNQADEPEQQRHGRVGRDREDVPDQRAAELRPQAHRVRVREQPVGRQPRPAGVEQREHAGARHGEQRHRLGEAVDRRAPLSACSSSRIAEISVPAWPMPIHQTKLTIVEAPADRDVDAPDADALRRAGRRSTTSSTRSAARTRPGTRATSPRGVLRVRTIELILSVTERERVAGRDDRRSSRGVLTAWVGSDGDAKLSAMSAALLTQLGVRVPHRRQVGRPRPRVQLAEQRVVARLGLQLRHAAVRVVQVAEDDRLGRAGLPGRRSRSRRRGPCRSCLLRLDLRAR